MNATTMLSADAGPALHAEMVETRMTMRPATRTESTGVARRAAVAGVLLLPFATTALAQEIRVVARDSTAARGIPQVLVTARRDGQSGEVRGLTNAAGEVVIRLPSEGRWSVAVRRIGLAPERSDAGVVGAGETVTVRFTMRATRFQLPAQRIVAASGICPPPDGGDARLSALWEQVTLALQGATLAAEQDASRTLLRSVAFDRELDRDLHLLSESPPQMRRGVGRPYAAVNPDSLVSHGYVRSDAERTLQYFAPDERSMMAESFVRTHCFDTPTRDASPDEAELRFRPAPAQRAPDVAGSAYVDAATGALQRITFRFVNADSLFPPGSKHAGGDVRFARLADGMWYVAFWSIRMPRMLRVSWSRSPRLTGYHEVGASVDTLVTQQTSVVTIARLETQPRTDSTRPRTAPAATESTLPTGDKVILGGKLIVETTTEVARRRRDWRTAFTARRNAGVGTFADSSQLAAGQTLFQLLTATLPIRTMVVPGDVPAPAKDDDPDLAESWVAGAVLPMMSSPTAAETRAECLVKLFLDGDRTTASRIRGLSSDVIAALEFYSIPRSVPEGYRRSGNLCGTVLLWSREQR